VPAGTIQHPGGNVKRIATAVAATLLTIGVAAAQAPNASSSGTAESTNSKTSPTLQSWMSDYSRTNNGYISRRAYMDEMGRRWDAMDHNQQGLTVDQINSMYGPGPTPGAVKAQTNRTNPTGTERKGQNSGQ
jgi:hypothetical protein